MTNLTGQLGSQLQVVLATQQQLAGATAQVGGMIGGVVDAVAGIGCPASAPPTSTPAAPLAALGPSSASPSEEEEEEDEGEKVCASARATFESEKSSTSDEIMPKMMPATAATISDGVVSTTVRQGWSRLIPTRVSTVEA